MEGTAAADSVGIVLDRGLPGVIILALAFVCWRLFLALQAAQEKRIEEAKASVTALESAASANEQLAVLIRDRLGRVP